MVVFFFFEKLKFFEKGKFFEKAAILNRNLYLFQKRTIICKIIQSFTKDSQLITQIHS